MTILVSSKPHLLSHEGMQIREFEGDISIGEIVDELKMPMVHQDAVLVELGGRPVPRNMWHCTFPKANTRMDVVTVYRGGDNGKKIMAFVAIIALTFITAGIGGYLAGMGWAATSIAMAQAGITLLGTLAISALFAPAAQDAQGSSDTADAYYTLSSQSNKARPGEGLMRIYGIMKVFPDVIAAPYITVVDGEEYLTAMYGFGYADVERDENQIGNVPIEQMEGPHAWVHNRSFAAGQALAIYRNDVYQEQMNLTLLNSRHDPDNTWLPPEDDEWRYFESEKNADACVLDILYPEGLFLIKDGEADPGASNIHVWIYYRKKGDTTWLNLRSLLISGNMHVESPNNSAAWKSDYLQIMYKRLTPFAVSISWDWPARDQYEFKVGRNDYPGGLVDNAVVGDKSRTVIRALQTVTKEAPIKPQNPISMTEIRFKASNQLTGTIDNFSARCKAYIPYRENNAWVNPVWTKGSNPPATSSWDHPWTNNPAWIYLSILKSKANRHPVTDEYIDLAAFEKWAAYCDQPSPTDPSKKYLTCNFTHTGVTTVWALLQKVAACGKASPSMSDSKYSIIFDAAAPWPVQMFTQRNSVNFVMTKTFINLPHAMKVGFLDADNDWAAAEVIAYSHGYDETNATEFESMTAFGCTDHDQAIRTGLFYLGQGELRNEIFTFDADIENLVCERGDRIHVAYDAVKEGGVPGRIIEMSHVGTAVDTIRMDQKHGLTTTTSMGVMIRAIDTIGGVSSHVYMAPINRILDDYSVGFSVPVEPITIAMNPGDLTVVGELQEVQADYLVTSIKPAADLSAQLSCTPYAPELQEIRYGGLLPNT